MQHILLSGSLDHVFRKPTTIPMIVIKNVEDHRGDGQISAKQSSAVYQLIVMGREMCYISTTEIAV